MKHSMTAFFFVFALAAAASPGCAQTDEGREPTTDGDAPEDVGLEPTHGGCTYVCSSTGKSYFPRSSCVANCPAPGTCSVDVC
jgi:hypothetical protein